jgi:NitT/TauT family transport system substrate-binding protein
MGVRVIRPGCVIALFAAAVLTAATAAAPARAQTAVKFTLDSRIEGPATPFLLAVDQGYFKSEGLDVTIEPAANPGEPITRVAAGSYDIGVGDINTLIRWRDQNPSVPLKAVFIVQNRPAYAIVTRKSRGVAAPKDLEDKKLGAPAADPASAQWPVFAKLNGIELAKVTVLNVGLPVREPMLAAGEVDAITGLSYGAPINLREKSVPVDDIVVLLMTDYGLELYGNAIFVNPKFAAEKPDAVKGFLRAYSKAVKETAADPVNAVLSVIQRNGAGSRDIELERLLIALKLHVLTPEVKANGLGEIDVARFERGLEQLALGYTFKTKLKAADIFDDSFLPPEAERKVE